MMVLNHALDQETPPSQAGYAQLALRRLASHRLGGWTRDRLSYLVMVAKIEHCSFATPPARE